MLIERLKHLATKLDIIVLLIPLVLGLGWIIFENHGFYGDEVTHIGFLKSAVNNAEKSPNIVKYFWELYRFNDRYPPFFYLLSAPFLHIFDDVILGARIYVLVLYLATALIFFLVLRQNLSRWSVVLGVGILCSSSEYLLAGRYYLLEIMILFLLLAMYLMMIRFLKTGRLYHVFLAGIFLSAGFLTKFNFVIYAAPVVSFFLLTLFIKLRNDLPPFYVPT